MTSTIRSSQSSKKFTHDKSVTVQTLDESVKARVWQQATQAHQTKQWDQAITCYQQILAQEPRHADALHLSALIRAEQQQWPEAFELMAQAIAIQPLNPVFYCNRAQIHRRLQQWESAIQDYQQAIRIAPRRAETYLALADTYIAVNRPQEAIAHYLFAHYLNPQQPTAAHHQLGNAFLTSQQYDAAIIAYEKALALNPHSVETLSNLGVVYAECGLIDKALTCHRQALAMNPQYGDGYINLGLALSEQGLLDEAEQAYQQALLLKPEQKSVILCNRGLNQQAQGDWPGALASFNQALDGDTHNIKARFNRATLSLLLGDYRSGWSDYEVRFQLNDPNHPILKTTKPLWQGEDLKNRTLLVYAEQGFGDTLQFARYLPLLKQRGATVIARVQPALKSFLQTQRQLGVREWIQTDDALPDFDYYVPLMNLPHRFQTELSTIPAANGYLQMDPSTSQLLLATKKKWRVGFVWAGNPQHKNDTRRSLPLDRLAPLLEMNKVAFYSLQYGPHSADIQTLDWQDRLVDCAPQLTDWQETARILTQLDVLITVDTAVAHLSGALGKPAWLLLPFVPDFRWLLERSDSPWYQSVRLFRQSQRDDWGAVIEAVKTALQEFVS